jgi:hypothetical protein
VFGADILSDAVFETKSELTGNLKNIRKWNFILPISDQETFVS